jgi:hypothetical protein
MCPVVVVIVDLLRHESLAVAFIEHDYVIEQIAAARADERFGHATLPRALDAGSFGLDPAVPDRINNVVAKVRATIEDQVAGRRVIRKRFAQLLRHPRAGRMTRHVEMQNLAPTVGDNEEAIENSKRQSRHSEEVHPSVMGDDKEAIENTEGERWHSKEVHRCDDFTVILQERLPSLCWLRISGRSSNPSQDGPLRDIEAEYLELAVNPRRAPGPVLGHHAEDKLTQLPAHAFSSRTFAMPGELSPVESEASSMPSDNSLGSNEDQGSLPSGPDTPQSNPEETIGAGKPWPRATSRKDQDLLPQSHVFQEKMMA